MDRKGEPARAGPTQPGETLLAAPRAQAARKTHLDWAVRLLRGVREKTTSYRHNNGSVKWKGVDGATRYESHTDCSGLLNFVFKRAYGLSDDALAAWLGTRRPVSTGAHGPLAKHYYNAIVKQNRFKRIAHLQDARPGDIIAIKYPPNDPGNTDNNTGHVLLVAQAPVRHTSSKPLVDGTVQWEVVVIDQSRSGHGKTDTRHRADGSFYPGLGRGVLRVYTNQAGTVRGYTWSTLGNSRFHDQKDRRLVIGRVQVASVAALALR